MKALFLKLNPDLKFYDGLRMGSITRTFGHEGETLIGGKIYFNNKHVATVSDGDWGGELNVKVLNRVLWQDFEKWVKENKFIHHVTPEHFLTVDTELYIGELLICFDLYSTASRCKKTSSVIYNPESREICKVNYPYHSNIFNSWFEEHKREGELVVTSFL